MTEYSVKFFTLISGQGLTYLFFLSQGARFLAPRKWCDIMTFHLCVLFSPWDFYLISLPVKALTGSIFIIPDPTLMSPLRNLPSSPSADARSPFSGLPLYISYLIGSSWCGNHSLDDGFAQDRGQ